MNIFIITTLMALILSGVLAWSLDLLSVKITKLRDTISDLEKVKTQSALQFQTQRLHIEEIEEELRKIELERDSLKIYLGDKALAKMNEVNSTKPKLPKNEVLTSQPMHSYKDGKCTACNLDKVFTTHCVGRPLKPEIIAYVNEGYADYTQQNGWTVLKSGGLDV